MDEAHWAIAPSERFGWNWAASWDDPSRIREGYTSWHVRWATGQAWGWQPSRRMARWSARWAARSLGRSERRRRLPKEVGSTSNDDLEQQFEKIKKELERRKSL